MKRFNKVELHIGELKDSQMGITHTRPEAIVVIETENNDLSERLVALISSYTEAVGASDG